MCKAAQEHPHRFHIGIDINAAALTKVSEKIYRKPGKGGLKNALFVQASVEDLPVELDGIADQLYVNFPWGSLLRAVAVGDEAVLGSLRRICSTEARLEITMGLDPERDRAEIERLGLSQLTSEFLEVILKPRYQSAGFNIEEFSALPATMAPKLHTSWARRLSCANGRTFIRLVARAR